MDLITKINKSRTTLKSYLQKEWDTSTIENYSDKEIEAIYTNKTLKKQNIISFGQASSCNFSLQHRKIPSHKLHIIYYNFPELNTNHVKITKTCADKINALYENEIIKVDDSVITIILEKITENLEKSIETIFINGQEKIMNEGLSDDVIQENESLEISEQLYHHHFRNIHIFFLDHLSIDISNHIHVPKHECIRNKAEIQMILDKCNATTTQLPAIFRTDPQAKIKRIAPGDICKITRTSKTGGENDYYRICV